MYHSHTNVYLLQYRCFGCLKSFCWAIGCDVDLTSCIDQFFLSPAVILFNPLRLRANSVKMSWRIGICITEIKTGNYQIIYFDYTQYQFSGIHFPIFDQHFGVVISNIILNCKNMRTYYVSDVCSRLLDGFVIFCFVRSKHDNKKGMRNSVCVQVCTLS